MFDLKELRSADTAEMVVRHPVTGEPTTWKMTIAGPSHPATIKIRDRLNAEALREARAREQAQVNGRKYKSPELEPDEVQERRIEPIAARIVGWTPVRIDGEDFPWSADNARRLLLDPAYGKILDQVVEFIIADENFFPSSASA